MADGVFFNVLRIVAFAALLWIGLKLSKQKLKHIKIGGYVLIVLSVLGMVIDLYNLIYKYLI